MGFDRNTVIGFALLGLLFIGFFWTTSNKQKALAEVQKEEQRIKDSITAATTPKGDTAQWRKDSFAIAQKRDSIDAGVFGGSSTTGETFSYLENNLMRVTFSNKGGWLKKIELKKYKGPDSLQVHMGDSPVDEFAYKVITGPNGAQESSKLTFNPAVINKTADGSQTISYQAVGGGKSITHSFVLRPDNYMVDAKIDLIGADQLLSQQTMNIHWQTQAHRQQHDVEYERTQTRLVIKTGEEFDYFSAVSGVSKQFEKPTQWVGLKQQFFNTTLLVKSGGLNGVQADIVTSHDTVKSHVATLTVSGRVNVSAGSNASVAFQLYYGPNDYYVLKKYDNDMFNIVDLGSGMFSFVKYINRWVILPVFSFLSNIMGGALGWAILLLTFLIRLVIAPLTYSSYLSGAKMKALRPEIDAMKIRLNNDQQKVSVEQMKMFREAGVNPLGGCIPALLQIPIFFALYSFFNSNIELRGIPFLWSHDLSSYDSILDLSFTIPFYGNHVSLFTITACLTSFLISMYSMSSTPDTGNPAMKYMPYIFPFMMLFIFNKLPSALTWYYTVSNFITLALQFVIQTYIIDHTKILAQIKENRTKPKAKSKWAERLEAMQATQGKVEDMKKKTGGGKK